MSDLAPRAETFRRLIEMGPDIVFRFRYDPAPHLDYVSPAITAITGYTPEELYADPELYFRILDPINQPRTLIERRTPSSIARPTTLLCHHKDGSRLWIEIRTVGVTDESGALIALEGTARDVTALIAAVRLEGVQLAAREIVHQLTNDLAQAFGYAELMAMRGVVADENKEMLAELMAGLQAMAQHIRQFDRIVRVETKETPVGLSLDLARSTAATN